jgi:hypothetical protein
LLNSSCLFSTEVRRVNFSSPFPAAARSALSSDQSAKHTTTTLVENYPFSSGFMCGFSKTNHQSVTTELISYSFKETIFYSKKNLYSNFMP